MSQIKCRYCKETKDELVRIELENPHDSFHLCMNCNSYLKWVIRNLFRLEMRQMNSTLKEIKDEHRQIYELKEMIEKLRKEIRGDISKVRIKEVREEINKPGAGKRFSEALKSER